MQVGAIPTRSNCSTKATITNHSVPSTICQDKSIQSTFLMMIRCSPSPEQMVMSASFRSANFDLMIINKNSSNAYHHDIVAEVIFLLCFFASLVLYRFRSFATSLFHYLSHSNVCIWTGFLNSISSVFLMFYFFMDFFFTSSSNF